MERLQYACDGDTDQVTTMTNKLLKCSPYINGSAYCGMLRENEKGSYGPDFVGPGPYYVAEEVDAKIERLQSVLLKYAFHTRDCDLWPDADCCGGTIKCTCGMEQAIQGT